MFAIRSFSSGDIFDICWLAMRRREGSMFIPVIWAICFNCSSDIWLICLWA